MTFEGWLVLAADYARKETGQRLGQAYFNSLSDYRPDITSQLCDTDYDPFFDDQILARFLCKVGELW